MPWTTPTLKETRRLTRDYVLTQLGAKAMIPNSVLRIMSDAMAGLAHLTLLYIDWLSKQLLPDTSETEWLDRHGDIWLVNADGTTGRKIATYAQGEIMFTGEQGVVIPAGTLLTGVNTIEYQTIDDGLANSKVPVVALTAGTIGNIETGMTFGLVTEIPGIDTATGGEITGGVNTETDEQLRERVLKRIQQPPQGGAKHDYEQWALAVPGVTRAWCAPLEMGMGTVTLRFMMDDLRAENGGFPTAYDIGIVETYIDKMRPVAVKDMFVLAPLPQRVDVFVELLTPDTQAVTEAIEKNLQAMLMANAAPGQTIYAAWKSAAIMSAPGVQSFHLGNNDDDYMPSPGHLAVLGDVLFY